MALQMVQGELTDIDRAALKRMAAAADEVLNCERVLAKSGDNVVGGLLRNQGTFYELKPSRQHQRTRPQQSNACGPRPPACHGRPIRSSAQCI